MFELSGARVLIAGGSSGIGLSTAKLLVRCGATVVVNGRDHTKLESVKKQLGDRCSIVAFDAAEPKDRARALAEIGSFDHLVLALSGGKGAGLFAQAARGRTETSPRKRSLTRGNRYAMVELDARRSKE
jgi:NADP-dependent 3-hydroxy acid dehydrogenase YdfG